MDEQLMRALGTAAVQYTACVDGDDASVECVIKAASEVARILGPDARPLSAAPQLVRAVMTLVKEKDFWTRLDAGTVSVAPFANLSVHLPEALRGEYSRTLKEVVVKDLAEPRATGTPRLTVFAMGELFARMVAMGHMPIDAAVNIITRMVKAPDKRMAGMTMLGKTVEFCFEQLISKASPAAMQALRDELLALVGDPDYAYDLEFTFESMGAAMGWTQAPPSTAQQPHTPAPAPAAHPVGAAGVSPSSPAGAPSPVASFPGRPGNILAMGVDSAHRAVVATVTPTHGPEMAQMFDPVVGFRGEFATSPPGVEMMTNSLDIIAPGAMLASMMPRARAPGDCCVRLFSFQNVGGAPPYKDMGCLTRPDARPLVSTRWLSPAGNSYAFVQGEAQRDPTAEGGKRQAVVVFEMSQGVEFAALQPAQQFLGHTGNIGTIQPYPEEPSLLLSSALDHTIRLWDRRTPLGRAGVLLYSTPGSQQAHSETVVTLSARGHTLMSAGMDKVAKLWDLRVLGQGKDRSTPCVASWTSPDGGPFLRATLAPQGDASPAALATACGGVYVADVHGAALASSSGAPPPALLAAGMHSPAAGRYHTLAWEPATGLLMGGWSAAAGTPSAEALPSRIDVWRS
jgi:hypothetical protein